MLDKDIINEEAVAVVKEIGCCLGKYRILIGSTYYYYLLNVYNCKYQNRMFVKIINSEMAVCTTNEQPSCEECDRYKNSSNDARDKLKVIIK